MINCTNHNLQMLVNKLNQEGINSLGIDYYKLKIFYNDNNKEKIFNLINELKTKKTGLTFSSELTDNENIKSVTIDFGSKTNANIDQITKIINYPTITDITTYLYIDSIIDNYSNKNINCIIEDNQEYKGNYLVTLEDITTSSNIDHSSFIINNGIENNLIHIICKQDKDNKTKVLYRALYETQEDLYSLLPIDNKTKKRTL